MYTGLIHMNIDTYAVQKITECFINDNQIYTELENREGKTGLKR